MVPTEKSKEMDALALAVLGMSMSMSVRMGIIEQRSLVESEGNSSNDGTKDQYKQ